MKNALIVVDAQYDFMEGGALEVPRANEIIRVINELLPKYSLVIATRDYHPANHKSFASQHEGKSVFDVIDLNGVDQVLWPDHCVQGNRGSDIHDDIDWTLCKDFYIFKKGTNPEVDSYSGFKDNNKESSTGLAEFLKERDIDEIDIVGLAGDYCVKYTALDAVAEGFDTAVLLAGVRFIDTNKKPHVDELLAAGALIVQE